ncbi:hypothetical protein NDU88_006310 [Pleurodeles waltl]|uniref:Uncharacterized protein n=1 Tax=Pleurodeles waltl TaxID=8319 RepID=A0AAV7WX92_PLEWA|nr:hypothetical protein NDU88_006310 [Pleurodeles waltl]
MYCWCGLLISHRSACHECGRLTLHFGGEGAVTYLHSLMYGGRVSSTVLVLRAFRRCSCFWHHHLCGASCVFAELHGASSNALAPGLFSLGRAVVDAILHHQLWVPGAISDDHVYQKRVNVNQKASCKRRATSSDLQVGDQVLLKEHSPGSKFHLPLDKNPWTIVRRNGSAVVAQWRTSTINRNISIFKKFHSRQLDSRGESGLLVPEIDQVSVPDLDNCVSTPTLVPTPSLDPAMTGSTLEGVAAHNLSTDRSTRTRYSLRGNPAHPRDCKIT